MHPTLYVNGSCKKTDQHAAQWSQRKAMVGGAPFSLDGLVLSTDRALLRWRELLEDI